MAIKVVIDKNIPFVYDALKEDFDVVASPACEITSETLSDARALLVRTRTRCNSALLSKSLVEFVATATIGYDHLDLEWCRESGVEVKIASGCNAGGVVNYVLRCLIEFGCEPSKTTVGVIGVGNVGTLLDERLRYFGFKTLLCDPIREQEEGSDGFVYYDELLKNSDVITIHTPLIKSGKYKTLNMVDTDFLYRCKDKVVFLNTSRGEVVDDSALISALKSGKVLSAALDVWSCEPNINCELLKLVDISTPHIAGYSIQGKANGSSVVVRGLANHFNVEKLRNWYPPEVSQRVCFDGSWREFKEVLRVEYDIIRESNSLKSNLSDFERFRNEYSFRNELL